MEIIGTQHFSVAVPIKSDPEFKAMILSAGVTHAMGNSSIDNIYRKNKNEFLERFDPHKCCPVGSVKECLLKIRNRAVSVATELSKLEIEENSNHGVFAAANSLIRIQATFHAAVQLSLNGLNIESDAVTRQGLEQVAWSLRVLCHDDNEEIYNTKPNKCIPELKKFIESAGVLYGILSDSAHVAPKTHERFISVRDDRVRVSIRDPDSTAQSAFYTLLLLDAYTVAVLHLCNVESVRGKKSIQRPDDIYRGCMEFKGAQFTQFYRKWRQNEANKSVRRNL